MQFRKGLIVPVVAIGLAIGFAGPAAAGNLFHLRVAKNPDGPFKDAVTAQLGVDDARNFYLRAKNRTADPDDFSLGLDFEQGDYGLKYFRGTNNITSEVKGDGYDFELAPGQVKKFRVRIKRQSTSDEAACVVTVLDHISGGGFAATIQINSLACDL
jgi:hypothetical protein